MEYMTAAVIARAINRTLCLPPFFSGPSKHSGMKFFAVVETSVQAMNLLGDDLMVGEFTFTAKHTKGNPAFLDQEGTGRRLTKFCLLRNCRACSTRVRRNVVGRPVRCRFALKVHKGGLSRNLLAAVQLHN